MGRLQDNLLDRVVEFADRAVSLAEALGAQGRSIRICDQLTGTAVGANVYEADEAISRKDFRKCLAIANKELSETRFWLRLIARRGWFGAERLGDLHREALELKAIIGSILSRTAA